MKTRDLFRLCLLNLRRRKSRTLLTALGVLIGCCSIVIMISIGIGMRESQRAMLAQMGDLTIITVYPQAGAKAGKTLDAAAVNVMRRLPGVSAVTPRLTSGDVSMTLYAGKDRRYTADYVTVTGMDCTTLNPLGFTLLEGESPLSDGKMAAVGQYFAYAFADTKRPEGYNTVDYYSMYRDDGTVGEPPKAYFDPLTTDITLVLTATNGAKTASVTVPVKVSGRMKENYSKGEETSQGMILDAAAYQKLLDRVRREAGIKTSKTAGYAGVLVKTEDIDRVAETEQSIRKLGFQTTSMESIRKPMEAEARQKQLLLGGLGAISLFVAALGITNTMIMSISERTREIGVMKSLGCFVRDIRAMFLMEAGAIGLLGGLTGSVLSLLLSLLMNIYALRASGSALSEAFSQMAGAGSRMSVIPAWLIAFAIAFSILIGLGSGYYPAAKAVRIPALEAIRES